MNDFAILQSTPLFQGLDAGALDGLLARLGAVRRSYLRGAVLVQAGQPNRSVGVVLSGAIEAARPAPDGTHLPITRMGPGGVFGDVLGGSSLTSPVTVTAHAACEVLLIPYDRLLRPDGSAAEVAAYLISEADRAGQLTFRIPFTRAQLAGYLNCDRSALSRELGRMQREGLLDTYRSSFKLLQPDALRKLSQ